MSRCNEDFGAGGENLSNWRDVLRTCWEHTRSLQQCQCNAARKTSRHDFCQEGRAPYYSGTSLVVKHSRPGIDAPSETGPRKSQLPVTVVVSTGRRNTLPKSYLPVLQWLNSFASFDSRKTLPCLGLIGCSPKDQVLLKNAIGSTD
jgi:hypothetical protein